MGERGKFDPFLAWKASMDGQYQEYLDSLEPSQPEGNRDSVLSREVFQATVIRCAYATARGIQARNQLVDSHEALRARVEEAEAYAKEGWDWLGEALEALGAKDVFAMLEGKTEKDERIRELEREVEALRGALETNAFESREDAF